MEYPGEPRRPRVAQGLAAALAVAATLTSCATSGKPRPAPRPPSQAPTPAPPATPSPFPALVPLPVSVRVGEGAPFPVTPATTIFIQSADPRAVFAAEFLAGLLTTVGPVGGSTPFFRTGTPRVTCTSAMSLFLPVVPGGGTPADAGNDRKEP